MVDHLPLRFGIGAVASVGAPIWVKVAVGQVGASVLSIASFSLLAGALAGALVPSLALPRPRVVAPVLCGVCAVSSALIVPDAGFRLLMELLVAGAAAVPGFALAHSSVPPQMPFVNRVAVVSCFWLAPAAILVYRVVTS